MNKRLIQLAILISTLTVSSLYAKEVSLPYQGLTLLANLELAPGKTLNDGVVLMTHGTIAHGKMEIMTAFQGLLKENGLNSISITLSLDKDRRQGMYDCASPHTHTHEDAVAEIGQWLEWLKQQGASKVTLLGHSRGGNQTAWFAAEHDDPVIKGVVLVAPMTWDAKQSAKGYQSRYKKPLNAVYKKAEKLIAEGKGDSLMKGVDFLYCADTTASAEAFVSYYRDEPRKHTPGILHKIEKPLLVIAGSEDTTVKDLIPSMKPVADGETIKLVVLDGADHFFRDLYAEDAVVEIVDFIGQ